MWNKTKATQLLGIKYPIIQGPFGGSFSSAELVASVSNSGGLGSFGLNAYSPDDILQIDASIKALTTKPYALNLWVPLKNDPAKNYTQRDFDVVKEFFRRYFDALGIQLPDFPQGKTLNFEEQVEAVFKARPSVMSFIFGIPSKEILSEAKRLGIITIGTITTLEEAMAVEEAGMDSIVASGLQAGGHRASFLQEAASSLTETSVLLRQVVPKVRISVVAAGGISNGHEIVTALKSGAAAVQIGTAFLATAESGATSVHKELLLSPDGYETTLTQVYTGRLARVISNGLTSDFEKRVQTDFAPYPLQSAFLSPLMQASRERGKKDLLAFYAGKPSASLRYKNAEALFKGLVEEASNVLDIQSPY